MRVLLDDHECEAVNVDSVGQAIAAAAALAEQRGRMIVEVMVDGRQWNGEELDSPKSVAAPADEIRLTSADPMELICQTFDDASRALCDADRLQQSAAELLQADQIPAGMKQLNEAISIWMSVQQALVMGLELAGQNQKSGQRTAQSANDTSATSPGDAHVPSAAKVFLDAQGVSINGMIDQLNHHLRMMHRELENKDVTALADTLLYDLPPVVRQWQDLLDRLQAHLSGRDKEA